MDTAIFNRLAQLIAATCNVDEQLITPDSHLFHDLGIDSLAMLDLAFDVRQEFHVKLPIEDWARVLAAGGLEDCNPFVVKHLAAYIEADAAAAQHHAAEIK